MFKYFKLEDFDCQETGVNGINVEFVSKLDELREACGFPFISFVHVDIRETTPVLWCY